MARSPVALVICIFGLGCSAVQPLDCGEDRFVHPGEDGLPVCGISESGEPNTWEIQDRRCPPAPDLVFTGPPGVLFGGLAQPWAGGCVKDIDCVGFELHSDALSSALFVEAEVTVRWPFGSMTGLDVFVVDAYGNSYSVPQPGESSESESVPVLMFRSRSAARGPTYLQVENRDGVECAAIAYEVDAALVGEAVPVGLGRVAASSPVHRQIDAPAGVQLFSVEADPGVRVDVRGALLDGEGDPSLPVAYLQVDADGHTVSYVDEETWRHAAASTRYFEVLPLLPMGRYSLTVEVVPP